MTVRKAFPFFWKYLLVVFTSCGLAFVISHNANASELNAPSAAVNPYGKLGAYTVKKMDEIWRDDKRQRTVPVRFFVPQISIDDNQKLFPVILFSHGLGGSKAGGNTWGEHWASYGFIVVHLQHLGSDESIWQGKRETSVAGEMKAAMTMNNLGLRIGDVQFAIDEIIKRAADKNSIFSRADVSKIGMSGHSFGAQTTLSVAGQNSPNVRGQTGLDTRIKAAIALSPNARNKTNMEKQFGDIRIPFFSITGTLDGEILNDKTEPIHRTWPYKYMPADNKYLLVLNDGDHTIFGGHNPNARRAAMPRDKEIQRLVKSASVAFWLATLNQDASALAWLGNANANVKTDSKTGFKSSLLPTDIFETK